MKSLTLALVFVLALAAPVLAADNSKVLQHLEQTRDNFLSSVNGLTEAQWNYKAAPDKWSIAECAEHIAAAESMLRGLIAKQLSEPLPADATDMVKDDIIVARVPERTTKVKAPEPLQPTNRFGSPTGAVEAFKKERAETMKVAETGDLRAHGMKNPVVGMLDSYGWMLFLSAHTARHTAQIEEVKTSAGYPK